MNFVKRTFTVVWGILSFSYHILIMPIHFSIRLIAYLSAPTTQLSNAKSIMCLFHCIFQGWLYLLVTLNNLVCMTLKFGREHLNRKECTKYTICLANSFQDLLDLLSVAEGERVELSRLLHSTVFKTAPIASYWVDLPYDLLWTR